MNRIEWYVEALRAYITANTGGQYHSLDAYLIADRIAEDPVILNMIRDKTHKRIHILDWRTLLNDAIWNWRGFLKALIDRGENDQRMDALKEYL